MNAPNDILERKPPKADLRLQYGHDGNQFLDLRAPRMAGPHPLAIFLHGGFWRAKYDLEYAGHLCAALAAKGIASANVEYRRIGNPGGGWPGTFADVRSAYHFLLQNATRYQLDVKRVIAMGHSAGSQLSLCLAAHEGAVKAVISLAGVVDLQRTYDLHLSHDAVVEFLGGTPAQVGDHYREADPMTLRVKARQWLVHGSDDDIVPPAFSKDYVSVKQKSGEEATFLAIAGAGHFDVVDPVSAAWNKIERAVLDATTLRA